MPLLLRQHFDSFLPGGFVGPLLRLELVRAGRRGRPILVRCLYAGLLMYALAFVYFVWVAGRATAGAGLTATLSGRDLRAAQVAEFVASFFAVFAALQLLAVIAIAPAAGAAVAGERERGTLVPLLGTTLRSSEYVLALLVARVASLGLVVVTGVPILALLEFLGGLDMPLVLAVFAVTGLTALSLTALGLLNSVLAPTARSAVMRTYAAALAYILLALASRLLLWPELGVADFPSTDTWTSPVTVADLVGWLNAGNPAMAAWEMLLALRAGTGVADVVVAYAWFHGTVALVCTVWTIVRFRSAALADESRDAATHRPDRLDALLGARPLGWKELVVDPAPARRRWRRLAGGCLVALALWPFVHLWYWFGWLRPWEFGEQGIAEFVHFWIRIASGVLGCIMLVQVGVRAAGAITGERSRGTLDALLASPLTPRGILFAKAVGSVLTPRGTWLVLALLWVLGLGTGALSFVPLPAYVLAWAVLAAFMAALGLYFSVVCRTTAGAALLTLTATAAVTVASFLIAFDFSGGGDESYVVMPPVVLGLLPFVNPEVLRSSPAAGRFATLAAIGLVSWLGLAVGLWCLAAYRLRVSIGRRREHLGDIGRIAGLATAEISTLATLRALGRLVTASASGVVRLPARAIRAAPALVPLLLPLLVMVAVYVGLLVRDEGRLREANAEADRLDPGWRAEELEAGRAPVPDAENSALVVERAMRLFPRRGIPGRGLDHEPVPREHYSAAELADIRAALPALADGIEEAERLADMPRGRGVAPWGPTATEGQSVAGNNARTVMPRLGYKIVDLVERGETDRAARLCRALVHAERSIGDEGMFMGQILRTWARGDYVLWLEWTLSRGQPSAGEMRALQDALEADSRDSVLLTEFRGGRAAADRMSFKLRHDPKVRFFLLHRYDQDRNRTGALVPIPSLETWAAFVRGSLTAQHAELIHVWNGLVEAAKQPEPLQQRAIASAATGLRWNQFIASDPHSAPSWALYHRRTLALVRCAAAALAAERFRLDNGRWPESLSDLVPTYLATISPDPYDGQPLRFRRVSDGIIIYTVGPNLRDDGGLIRATRRTPPADIGSQLWDPDARR